MKLPLTLAAASLACACFAADMPEQGDDAARFAKFDQAIRDFAREHEIAATVAAVSEHGSITHLRSFGFADAERTHPLTPGARFRIASVTKPITAAAVKTLIRDGKFQAATPVLDILKQPPWPQPKDARWRDITIQHLLDHRGGWDRDAWGDPMFMQVRILKQTGHKPEKPDDVVRWMMTQPLQFNPGATNAYANFGYCVLGRVIETTTRRPYLDYINATIAKPCGITSWALARGGAQRQPGEIWYDFGKEGENFHIWLMDSHGAIISTASDLCRFMARYWLNGEPRTTGRGQFRFYGSLPGTTAIVEQRRDGTDFAVLLNKRRPTGAEEWHALLRQEIDAALDAETQPTPTLP